MREVLRDYLGALPGFEVCGESESAEEALEKLDAAAADLVLVDTSLPHMTGIDFVGEVAARWGSLPCLMLSGHGHEGYVQRALAAGARGYVLKGDPAELPGAIREVLGGHEYVSPRLRGGRPEP
jgi:DNA-binding NarL/FixJ family response regulator